MNSSPAISCKPSYYKHMLRDALVLGGEEMSNSNQNGSKIGLKEIAILLFIVQIFGRRQNTSKVIMK